MSALRNMLTLRVEKAVVVLYFNGMKVRTIH